jgi:hypothetical protein
MGRLILIVLIFAVLFIAFKYFKVNVSNSALRNEENNYLPDASSDEAGDGNDAADESDDGNNN